MSSISLPRVATPAAAGTTWRDRLRRVADAAVTPLDLDDVLDVFAPLRAGAPLRGRIVEVRPETAHSATIVLEPGKDWRGHQPGQYVRVGVEVDGIRLWRTYSLTHGPRRDGYISITVKAIPGGVVSGHLVHRARVGQVVQLDQAQGDFVLPPQTWTTPEPAKLLMVTGGSGITPVVGMLRNLFNRATPVRADIVLLHSALTHDDVIFGRELREYAERGLITLIERHTDVDGMLAVTELEQLVPDLVERTTYACGPAGLLDALEEFCAAAGLPLHVERFRPPVLSGLEDAEGGTVAFADGTVVDAGGTTPILDAGEAAGVLMPSGCRMGVCFGCVVPMTAGAVRDLRNGALTIAVPGETGPGGIPIQTCVSAAAGDCTIDVGG
ncbi:ferredoxin reductase [Nocardioides sp. R-C-SC26]|uniref:ferredoxin reductase n=1 Tax=Nocardioides sp. R-C-SC26 TaxID=2870414 RepID=UPI001E553885|nr:ferredoxin reductase [Nocardioides sp. R-C-SC26]